jgi:hypothetical protein
MFAVILFRTAWISDDAAITLRTVLNVTHGFGLTFNIAERVQTYTHPLGRKSGDRLGTLQTRRPARRTNCDKIIGEFVNW